MERQRENIRNALFHMRVWNCFDPVLTKQKKGQTLAESVRLKAANN